jgi:hypothetical protein
MIGFFDTWTPGQFLALVATVAGAVSLIVLILTVYGYNLRALADATALQRERLQAETSLKRELSQRGLPPQELEQAVKVLHLDEPPPAARVPDNELSEAEFATIVCSLEGITPQAVEEILTLVRAADGTGKRTALSVIQGLMGRGVEAGPLALAAVRSLCRPTERPPEEAQMLELSSHVTRR